jgi:hypothetical protein
VRIERVHPGCCLGFDGCHRIASRFSRRVAGFAAGRSRYDGGSDVRTRGFGVAIECRRQGVPYT